MWPRTHSHSKENMGTCFLHHLWKWSDLKCVLGAFTPVHRAVRLKVQLDSSFSNSMIYCKIPHDYKPSKCIIYNNIIVLQLKLFQLSSCLNLFLIFYIFTVHDLSPALQSCGPAGGNEVGVLKASRSGTVVSVASSYEAAAWTDSFSGLQPLCRFCSVCGDVTVTHYNVNHTTNEIR